MSDKLSSYFSFVGHTLGHGLGHAETLAITGGSQGARLLLTYRIFAIKIIKTKLIYPHIERALCALNLQSSVHAGLRHIKPCPKPCPLRALNRDPTLIY